MSGLFGTLHIGTNGMAAAQTALQTTSHNIANANTEGYSRQRINFTASNPHTLPGVGQIGTGVKMQSVVRVVDDYLTEQTQTEAATLEMYSQKADALGQLESIFNEPSENGLSNSISKFYSAWAHLSANPELTAAKTTVSQEAETLTDTVNQMASQMQELQEATTQDISKQVLDFNAKVKQLDTLNQQIFSVAVKGQTPNDLLDQRDELVGELTNITSIEVATDAFQRAFIRIDGTEILGENTMRTLSVVTGTDEDGNALISTDGSKANTRPADAVFEVGQLILGTETDGATAFRAMTSTSGHVRGSQEALTEINTKRKELDKLTTTMAKAVNTVHSGNGEGIAFFDLGSGANAALTIKVNKEITTDPRNINAGKSLTASAAGDGTRAGAIASLQTQILDYATDENRFDYDETTMVLAAQSGGRTTADAYNDIVTRMGITKQQADDRVESQGQVVSFLEERRASISGVSVNEEVVDIMKYQSAFQANAKVLAVVSEMLDTLINRTGV